MGFRLFLLEVLLTVIDTRGVLGLIGPCYWKAGQF